jgi:hypothetical protein
MSGAPWSPPDPFKTRESIEKYVSEETRKLRKLLGPGPHRSNVEQQAAIEASAKVQAEYEAMRSAAPPGAYEAWEASVIAANKEAQARSAHIDPISIVKGILNQYMTTARSIDKIRSLRARIVSIIKAKPHDGSCSIINPSDVLDIVSELSTALFGEYVSETICASIKSVVTDSLLVPGAYDPDARAFLINCKFIDATLPELEKLGDIQFANQEYRYSMDSVEKMVLLIEHEFIHYLVHIGSIQNTNAVESFHGTPFITLAKHLFNQGWGDLAMAHLHHYQGANGDRETFRNILQEAKGNFTEEYITTVFNIIDGYFNPSKASRAESLTRRSRKHRMTRNDRNARRRSRRARKRN